jgi:ATP-dependent Clp protease ATP-binding subunit ClpA
MPSFARELEQTLHNALGEASKRRHEYATLEHLLIALIDDEHASKVMTACGVSRVELRASVKQYLDNELGALVADSATDPTPTSGFQRVVQRAILHVQSSGKKEVTGANVLVAIYGEKDSHAVYFLHQQGVSRLDVVNFISHGISKHGAAPDTGSVLGGDGEEGSAAPSVPRSIATAAISARAGARVRAPAMACSSNTLWTSDPRRIGAGNVARSSALFRADRSNGESIPN